MASKNLLLIFSLIVQSVIVQAQQKAKDIDLNPYREYNKKYFDKKIGDLLAPMQEWLCIDGTAIDLYKTNRPAVIYFGFASCGGCRQQMPAYVAVANEKQYESYDFLYMTFDDSAEINKEMRSSGLTNNRLRIISVPEKYLTSNYVRGYPAIYFLDKEKTVKIIYSLGAYESPIRTKEDWYPLLEQIK
jgi:thiol-disulfide isomerase/thioredoxin